MPVPPPSRPVVDVDASALTADAAVLEALMRLQLDAVRRGTRIRLCNAPQELVDLLVLVGLSDVLPADARSGVRSGVEVEGQIEEGEQARVDEEVDPGDPAG